MPIYKKTTKFAEYKLPISSMLLKYRRMHALHGIKSILLYCLN